MMKSPSAQRLVRKAQDRASDRSRGVTRSVAPLSFDRIAETLVGDIRKLPVLLNTTALQNEWGQFLFLDGYSQPGGPDVGG